MQFKLRAKNSNNNSQARENHVNLGLKLKLRIRYSVPFFFLRGGGGILAMYDCCSVIPF